MVDDPVVSTVARANAALPAPAVAVKVDPLTVAPDATRSFPALRFTEPPVRVAPDTSTFCDARTLRLSVPLTVAFDAVKLLVLAVMPTVFPETLLFTTKLPSAASLTPSVAVILSAITKSVVPRPSMLTLLTTSSANVISVSLLMRKAVSSVPIVPVAFLTSSVRDSAEIKPSAPCCSEFAMTMF